MDALPASCDVAIVGGGFAGAATAWWIARRGGADVVMLERESSPGRQASGRGAGMGGRSLGRMAQPDEIARVAVFLATSEAAWITGELIHVNGGFYMA